MTVSIYFMVFYRGKELFYSIEAFMAFYRGEILLQEL